MSRRVVTTEVADSDIRNIASYIAFDNSHASAQFGQELWTAVSRIAENPEIGRVVPEVTALRVTRVSRRFYRYLIFYRVPGPETIEVVRVLHAARDITAFLRDNP
jgi:plasmid stabilization system protein ParE